MGSIEASQWIGSPRLLLIEDKTGSGLSEFRLGFDQVSPAATPESTRTDVSGDDRPEMQLLADSRR
jgi:type IV pilus assembly protein PilN